VARSLRKGPYIAKKLLSKVEETKKTRKNKRTDKFIIKLRG